MALYSRVGISSSEGAWCATPQQNSWRTARETRDARDSLRGSPPASSSSDYKQTTIVNFIKGVGPATIFLRVNEKRAGYRAYLSTYFCQQFWIVTRDLLRDKQQTTGEFSQKLYFPPNKQPISLS